MIKTRIPPVNKTLVLISDILLSFVHSSTCLSKMHPHDVTEPVVHFKKINETSKKKTFSGGI